ncbi:MAG TPA: hypothetical protein VFS07_03670 [Gemmatimonadales bacterium]|nr:hypothetical protein [Gemmatimonadales bacterium]
MTQVVLGLLFWTGRALDLTHVHMGVGLLFVITYLYMVSTARLGPRGLTLAVLLGVVLPVFGMLHTRLLVGPWHWTIQVLHLLLGIAAMAVVDRTARRLRGAAAPAPAASLAA